MPEKDPESTIGVGGRAMFWEGVFSSTSAPQETGNAEKNDSNVEESHSAYDHREVRPAKPKE